MVPSLLCLAIGRVLGGLATSILFSVFESWLISSAKSKGMTQGEIGALLGRCTLVNGIVASLAGVVSDAAVRISGTYRSPFVLSGVLLVTAGVLIRGTWEENYGGAVPGGGRTHSISKSIAVLKRSASLNPCARTFPDGVVNCRSFPRRVGTCHDRIRDLHVPLCLLVRIHSVPRHRNVADSRHRWVPTLQGSTTENLPLGSIFSSFMIFMMLGSLLCQYIL